MIDSYAYNAPDYQANIDAKKYVENFIKEISILFDKDFDLTEYASNLYILLNADGFNDYSIKSGKSDSRLYEYICDGVALVKYAPNYKELFNKIIEKVSNIYDSEIQEARKKNKTDSMFYNFYAGPNAKRYMATEILAQMIRYNISEDNLDRFIDNYITNRRVEELSVAEKMTRKSEFENSMYRGRITVEESKKIAIVLAVLAGICWISKICYEARLEKEKNERESNKPKYAYATGTASQSSGFVTYDLDTNEFVIGDDSVARL